MDKVTSMFHYEEMTKRDFRYKWLAIFVFYGMDDNGPVSFKAAYDWVKTWVDNNVKPRGTDKTCICMVDCLNSRLRDVMNCEKCKFEPNP